MPRATIALLLVLLTYAADAAPRRRAARVPADTAAGWLANHAVVLSALELRQERDDLEPLRALLGDVDVVALGDGTHGTREFYTVKLRLLDFLVREMGFTSLAFEAPFPITERINHYVQGADGDPRAVLRELHDRLNYFFWNTEEVLETIEWMRDYNLHRGCAPAIEITGFDIFDVQGAVAGVLAYLRNADPAAAAQAESDYRCVQERVRSSSCLNRATAVRERLSADRDRLVAVAGERGFADALQHASTVLTFFDPLAKRDATMAENILWIRQNRSANGRTVVWAHQEHLGTAPSQWVPNGTTAGMVLREKLGDDYFVIGTLTGSGTYALWERSSTSPTGYVRTLAAFPPPLQGLYEWQFRQHPAGAIVVPMRAEPPAWLVQPALFRTAGNTISATFEQSLAEKLDAVIYIDVTTATRPLP